MIQLFTQLAQSVTGAVITIIALLLVAAIIGYFTAWFYAKSVYTPVIKGLEADKQNLNRQVAALNEDVARLTGKVDKLNEDIKKLQEEIAGKDNVIAEKEKEITALKKQKITS